MVRFVTLGNAGRALLLIGMGALAGCQAADGTSEAPDVAMVKGLMAGLGAVDPNAEQIEYKPRAPLAMPANPKDLPPPETEVAAADANWPSQNKDDLAELKELYAGSGTMQREGLTPEQMRGFRVSSQGKQRDRAREIREQELIEGGRMTSVELQQNKGVSLQAAEESLFDANGNPKRRYLTEPPVAYSTPSPDAPLPNTVRVKDKREVSTLDKDRVNMRCLEDSSNCPQ